MLRYPSRPKSDLTKIDREILAGRIHRQVDAFVSAASARGTLTDQTLAGFIVRTCDDYREVPRVRPGITG